MRREFGGRGALGCLLLLAACATGMQSAPAAARSVSLADMAGTWNMRTLNMAGDSVLVTYEIFSTGDLTGWTLTFPGRPPIPVRVIEVSGDSVVLDAGPYASALRQDVTVSTRFDMQLRDGRLTGLITAIYNMPDGDTTVPLRVEGTRADSATPSPNSSAAEGSMYGLIGKMSVAPGQRDLVEAALLDGTAAMPGCLSYVIARDRDDPNALWITEVWDSAESHRASLQLPAVQAAIARARPFITGFSNRVETTPIGGSGLLRAG